ncbi:MAG: hypothetical protein Kow0059_03010 [Candidatus Sumerlaeia bacterium]
MFEQAAGGGKSRKKKSAGFISNPADPKAAATGDDARRHKRPTWGFRLDIAISCHR